MLKPFMSLILRLLALVSLFAAGACSQGPAENPPDRPVAMEFEVDETLLEPAIKLGRPSLTLRPPLGWAGLEETRKKGLLEQFRSGAGILRLYPVDIFLDSLSGCALVVSQWESDSLDWDAVCSLQRTQIGERFTAHELMFDDFLLDKNRCLQTIIRDSLMTNYKLLLDFGAQLDYLVPRAVHVDQLERVESSIGTVRSVPVP